MTLTGYFQGPVLKKRSSGMGWPIDMGRKGCESIKCWTHVVTFNLTLDFHGQILKKSYLRNVMAGWRGTKGMWVDKMLDPFCNLQGWPHPWPWPWIIKVNFWKAISQGWDGRLTWNKSDVSQKDVAPCCDFQRSPHQWPWPWIFKVNCWKCCISGMGWPIGTVWKGCEWIEWWTHVVTFNLVLTLDFQGQILKNSYPRNEIADWHATKGVRVDRMLHHVVTFNFHFTHDLDLEFSRSNFEKVVSQEWDGRLTRNKRDLNGWDVAPCCYFQRSPHQWPWPWIFKVKFWK